MADEAFRGEITVASRIVDYLSSGLYNSPAACLKELVNNSFDADATRVDVLVKPDANRIIVTDDGIGMTRDEFVQHFARVSESHKRDADDHTPSGRPKIGKIGIGFIAANELCNVMEIISTKKGSTELLRVEINFREMRLAASERRRDDESFIKGDYEGVVSGARRSDHYTHVLLREIRPNAQGILAGALNRKHIAGQKSTYGLKPESVRQLVAAAVDWGDFDEYSQTILKVGLNVPVRYLPDWYPIPHRRIIGGLEREVSRLNFSVFADGSDLRKPVVLDPGDRQLLDPIVIDGANVSARGYLFTRHRVIRPQWLNGILLRIRYAAVGEYDATFLNFKSSENTLFQRWTSGELWADDRLEEALNIDRRTFRITHPAYVELQEAFHDALSAFLTKARRQLYTEPATARRRDEARNELDRIEEVIDHATQSLPIRARRELRGAVRRRTSAGQVGSPRDVRAVLKRYSVGDVYEVVLEVARDTLPPLQYERFTRALVDRLLG